MSVPEIVAEYDETAGVWEAWIVQGTVRSWCGAHDSKTLAEEAGMKALRDGMRELLGEPIPANDEGRKPEPGE
jgi:hypothetical protein